MNVPTPAELRRHPRLPVNLIATRRHAGAQRQERVTNLSTGGVALLTQAKLALGSFEQLEISTSNGAHPDAQVVAEVVRVQPAKESGHYLSGLKFRVLDATASAGIEQLLLSTLYQPTPERSPRFEVRQEVLWTPRGFFGAHTFQLHNLSATGALLSAAQLPPANSLGMLSLRGAGSDDLISVPAEVIWRRRDDLGDFAGIRFGSDEQSAQLLRQIVRTLLFHPPQRGAGAAPGSRIGEYELEQFWLRGQSCELYRAKKGDQPIALRRFRGSVSEVELWSREFLNASRLAPHLNAHPGIVQVYGAIGDSEECWLATELLDTPSLEHRLISAAREGLKLDLDEVLDIGRDVLLTLDDCHRNLTDSEGQPLKLLHGDIRPSRVFLDGGHARLTGFGAPFDVRPERLLWLPPEALEGRAVTEQSDVYQVGVLLYEALTGVLPFRAQTAHQLLAAIVDGPRPISSLNPMVPRSIDDLVRRALSFSPSGRPASAQAFAQTLARIDLNAPITPMELVSPVAVAAVTAPPENDVHPLVAEVSKAISLPGPVKRGDQIGRYEVIGKLNAGGMSELFVAKSAQHPWPMVLKTLLPSLLNDADATMMFMNEARLLSEVEHNNIVRVTDVGFDHQRPFMAMEYFPGRPLAEVLIALEKTGRLMPPHLATYIISEAAAGLECTHTRRGADGKPLHIVHRDVTSRNLLVGYRGHVKVIDFGLARSLGMDRLTSPGHVRGNAPWVAPEQVMGKPLTAATDVWALGINLYLMLTGKLPFEGETPFEVLQHVLETEPVGVRRLRPEIPEAIAEILPRALAKSMVERYPSAGDMREDALQVLSDAGDVAKELGELMESLFPRRIDPERLRVAELAGETVMPKDAPSPLRRLMGWFKEVSS